MSNNKNVFVHIVVTGSNGIIIKGGQIKTRERKCHFAAKQHDTHIFFVRCLFDYVVARRGKGVWRAGGVMTQHYECMKMARSCFDGTTYIFMHWFPIAWFCNNNVYLICKSKACKAIFLLHKLQEAVIIVYCEEVNKKLMILKYSPHSIFYHKHFYFTEYMFSIGIFRAANLPKCNCKKNHIRPEFKSKLKRWFDNFLFCFGLTCTWKAKDFSKIMQTVFPRWQWAC